jgi:hypothetical protein
MFWGPRPLWHLLGCWWLGSSSPDPVVRSPLPVVAPRARVPTLHGGELFVPKGGELAPLHVQKKFSFRGIHPLQVHAALEA